MPATTGLYWAEAAIVAPLVEGPQLWMAKFFPSNLDTPHTESSLAFSLITVKPPEHRIRVEVVEEGTNTAVDATEVRLGAFRTQTNEDGIATLEVPKGTYELNVWKMGYELVQRTLEINSDQCIKIELQAEPEPSPFL